MDSHLVENHKTKINGIDIEIAEAKLQRCDTCNRIAVPAGEIKRWEKLQEEGMTKRRKKTITVELTVAEAKAILIRANSGTLEYGPDNEPKIAAASVRAEKKIRRAILNQKPDAS